jgi:hypothetical protein
MRKKEPGRPLNSALTGVPDEGEGPEGKASEVMVQRETAAGNPGPEFHEPKGEVLAGMVLEVESAAEGVDGAEGG